MQEDNNVYEIARRRGVKVKTVQNWAQQARKRYPDKIPRLTYATVLTREQEDLICIEGRKADNVRNPRNMERSVKEYRNALIRIENKLDQLLAIWKESN